MLVLFIFVKRNNCDWLFDMGIVVIERSDCYIIVEELIFKCREYMYIYKILLILLLFFVVFLIYLNIKFKIFVVFIWVCLNI